MSMTDILIEHAKDRPDHPAIEDLRAGRVVTYADLHRLVDDAAANLLDLGVQAQDIVGVMLPNSADHIIARLALEQIGAVIIPIRRTVPNTEKRATIDDLSVKAVITNSKYRKTVPPGLGRLDIDAVCAGRVAQKDGPISSIPASHIDASRPLIATRSSGTTGDPKRLLLSRGHIWERSRIPVGPMQLTSKDRFLQVPGLEYVHGYGLCLTMLLIGGTVVIGDPKLDLFSHFTKHRITLVCLSPSHLLQLLHSMDDDSPRFPNLTVALTGAPVTSDLRALSRKKFSPKIIDWYGTSEVGGLTTAAPQDHEKYPDSVGRPMDGIEVQVVDDDGRPLPPMEIGQIGFRSDQFPTEYHNNPEATAQHFRGGWFYPGDFAAINEEGYIFLMGRTDDAINHMGQNFYPIETERVLQLHPAVVEAAVFGVMHRILGEVPVAAVVASEFVATDALEKLCEEHLETYKRPQLIQLVPELPRNLGGKVIKSKLEEAIQAPWKEQESAEAGEMYQFPKDYDRVIGSRFDEAKVVEPESAESHYERGKQLAKKGDHRAAAQSFRSCVALEPKTYKAWSRLGESLAAQQEFAAAADAYREALKLRPESYSAHRKLSEALSRIGQVEEAWRYKFPEAYDRENSPWIGEVRQQAFDYLFNTGIADFETPAMCLDLACGTGLTTLSLAEYRRELLVIGIDASQQMLAEARSKAEQEGLTGRCSFREADVLNITLGALPELEKHGRKDVDMITCALGFSVFPRWEEAFHRTNQLLHDDGVYVIFDQYISGDTGLAHPGFGANQSRESWKLLEQNFINVDIKWFGNVFIAIGHKKKKDQLSSEPIVVENHG